MSETTTLELVDAALAEGRPTAVSEDDRSLQMLALAIADETRPEPDPDCAREMAEWAAAGFRRGGSPDKDSLLDRIAHLLRTPLGMATATAAVAAVAVFAVVLSDSSQNTTTDHGNASVAQSESAGGSSAAATPTTPAPTESFDSAGTAPPDAAAPPATKRSLESGGGSAGATPQEKNAPRIERSAELTVVAPKDKFDEVADQVVRVTDRHNGFILSSSVSSGDDSGDGDFVLKVPADQLQPALRDLSELGHVKMRSEHGQDVTAQYVSAADKLQAARAERKSLLRRLSKASDDAQANRLRDRLDQNALEINSYRNQIREVLGRTNYSTIQLTLERSGKDSGTAAAGKKSSTDDALHDSLSLLIGSFNWLLRALGVLIPVGIVAGGAWFAASTFRRRRREAVLF